MRKIIFIIFVTLPLLLTSCITTSNPNANVFSSSAKSQVGNMVISTDEFTDTKTAVHKDIGIDFTKGTYGLYFEPYFIYDDENVNYFLRVQYDYFGTSVVGIDKIILLGDTGKIQINITATPEIESRRTSSSILGNDNKTRVSQKISRNDYIRLSQFFANNSKIRLGFYLTGNKAQELAEYTTRAHAIFADALAFHEENLTTKKELTPENVMLFQIK